MKRQLYKDVWAIANEFRKLTGGNLLELKNYLFAFLFYKQLSYKCELQYKKIIDNNLEGIDYENLPDGLTMELLMEDSDDVLGYHIEPKYLWSEIIKKINKSDFDLDYINKMFENLTKESKNDKMAGLFEDIDFFSNDLGPNLEKKKDVLSFLISKLDKVDYNLENEDTDLIGDLFEYLLSKFSENGGKAGGEFYTPQSIAEVLAKIVTKNKTPKITLYDPTCGSGGLLLKAIQVFGNKNIEHITGQEKNHRTYNLSRMNIFIRSTSQTFKFTINNTDTLLESKISENEKFTSILANPPYGGNGYDKEKLKQSNNSIFNNVLDVLPSKSNGEILFLHHILHHLADDGTAAIILPSGVAFRTNEKSLRKRYIENDYIESIIILPKGMFYGTSIDPYIFILKKCKNELMKNKIKFIDVRGMGYIESKQRKFSKEEINEIVSGYETNEEIKAKHLTTYIIEKKTISEHNYTLNIDAFVKTNRYDIKDFDLALKENKKIIDELNRLMKEIEKI